MTDALQDIPPEAWPFIGILFNLTMAAAGLWLATTAFVMWRRQASNLTPVNAAEKNKKAQPDFLKTDEKARREMLERGESFDKELERRDRATARAAAREGRSAQKLTGAIALVMSLFTLASIIYGSIFNVSRMGDLLKEYSSVERMAALVQSHPIAFAITIIVIVARVFTHFSQSHQQEL